MKYFYVDKVLPLIRRFEITNFGSAIVRLLSKLNISAEFTEAEELYFEFIRMYGLDDTKENWRTFLRAIV